MNEVLKKLKQATSALHRKTETLAYGELIMAGMLQPEMYISLLKKNWIIHTTLERVLSQATSRSPELVETFYTPRSNWLQKDLQQAQAEQDELSAQIIPFSIKTSSDLIGLLYVMEGSMLGGRMIVKRLNMQPNLAGYRPFHFYSGEGVNTSKRWKNFALFASQIIDDDRKQQQANLTAKETFRFFQKVYDMK